MKTMLVKSHHPDQGDFILINEEDFDAAIYEPFGPPPPPPFVEPAPVPPAQSTDPLDSLPADWREDGDVKAIAFAVSGRAVENKEQAVAVIEAALLARSK